MYDLSVLNDREFESLAKDVLEHQLSVPLQIFRRGRDKGIDLRYAEGEENRIVVQVKHYVHSTFADLKRTIINGEKKKIAALKPPPERYIIFTSLSLSVAQVDELVTAMEPYIRDSNDIYGRDRIIEYLKRLPDVEEKHYKLWLTSANVLKAIISNGIKGRSEFYEEKIQRKIKLYVPTTNYADALKKLNDNRFIVITGEPGVGKTTIAYMLICELLAQGHKLIYINDRINEAEQLISPDPRRKQILYFDDFLGSNIAEIMNPRNSESTIVGLIERISSAKNKFLILTTRTIILNQALEWYEKLHRSDFTRISNFQVEVGQYSRNAKEEILYNHLYHSGLSERSPEFRKVFYDSFNEHKIVSHRNFSPRLIEFITNEGNFRATDPRDYWKAILGHLENPEQLWKGAYENQLEDEDRFILTTLFSLGGLNVLHHNLESAFQARIRFEIQENGFRMKNDVLNKSLRRLLDGFVIAKRDVDTEVVTYSFVNPSVNDFLLNYLRSRPQEKWRMIRSVIFIGQITHFFYSKTRYNLDNALIGERDMKEFFKFFNTVAQSLSFRQGSPTGSMPVEVLKIYCYFFQDNIEDASIKKWVDDLRGEDIHATQFSDTIRVLKKLSGRSISGVLKDKLGSIIRRLTRFCESAEDFGEVKSLFEDPGFDLQDYFDHPENVRHMSDAITSSFFGWFYDSGSSQSFIDSQTKQEFDRGNVDLAIDLVLKAALNKYITFVRNTGFSDFGDILKTDLEIDRASVVMMLMHTDAMGMEAFDSDVF